MNAFTDYFTLHPTLALLLALMGLDILSGLIASAIQGTLDGKTAYIGMLKKASILLVVTAAGILEPYANGLPLLVSTSMAFCGSELISFFENVQRAGVPIPGDLFATTKVFPGTAPIVTTETSGFLQPTISVQRGGVSADHSIIYTPSVSSGTAGFSNLSIHIPTSSSATYAPAPVAAVDPADIQNAEDPALSGLGTGSVL